MNTEIFMDRRSRYIVRDYFSHNSPVDGAWEVIWIWIYWQTANEGRPRPEELIGTQRL